MVSFIHCASDKWVYRFPSGNLADASIKLADAREGGG